MSSLVPFQELVDVLRRALQHISNPPASPPAITSANTTVTPSPPVYASPMAKPAPFSGLAEDCNGFLLQCSLVLEMHPHLYPDDLEKVAFIFSQLNGRALQWAETIWSQNSTVTQSLTSFVTHFKVFGRPAGDSSIGEQLYHLKQGTMTMNEYALKFRTLAAASGWNKQSLLPPTVRVWIHECGCISLHTRIPSG